MIPLLIERFSFPFYLICLGLSVHEYVFTENDMPNDCITSTHRFRIVFILLSFEVVFKSYRFQSFSCRCKVKTQRKVFGFDENDMKTYSCSARWKRKEKFAVSMKTIWKRIRVVQGENAKKSFRFRWKRYENVFGPVYWMLIKNGQRTVIIWCVLTELLHLKVKKVLILPFFMNFTLQLNPVRMYQIITVLWPLLIRIQWTIRLTSSVPV